jgi:hypothetical protein
MSLDEYIDQLIAIREHEGGEIEVETTSWSGGRQSGIAPRVTWKLILKGRESTPRFWDRDGEDRKGDKVVKI